ncbi:hypothetical protein [Streptomyces sp. XY431]|uniref:hypothetical protein n=1 Tax=Streptomyces sp. XY431 TaxID=1415562 RepID=UPI000A68470A|nr:hypothetical protein [Streptomyces sp. XY431]
MTNPQTPRRPLWLADQRPAPLAPVTGSAPRPDPWEGLVPPPAAPARPTTGRRPLGLRPDSAS